jgi:hypothetical protein
VADTASNPPQPRPLQAAAQERQIGQDLVYDVTPTTVFGFGTDETFGATRWRLGARMSSRRRAIDRRVGAQRHSCSSPILLQQTAEQVAPTHSALLILASTVRPAS